VALLVVMLSIRFQVIAVAQPIPYVLTDRPLYTSRDGQVLLQGSGYEPVKNLLHLASKPS
jgi:hypothetical protein